MPDDQQSPGRIEELRKRWEQEPGSRLFLQLADELRRVGQVAEAAEVLGQGLERRPNDLSGMVALSRCRLELGQIEEALPMLDSVVSRDPGHLVANKLLIEAHLQRGDAEKAAHRLDLYRMLNDRDPELEELQARLEALSSGSEAPVTSAPELEPAEEEPPPTPPADTPSAEPPPPPAAEAVEAEAPAAAEPATAPSDPVPAVPSPVEPPAPSEPTPSAVPPSVEPPAPPEPATPPAPPPAESPAPSEPPTPPPSATVTAVPDQPESRASIEGAPTDAAGGSVAPPTSPSAPRSPSQDLFALGAVQTVGGGLEDLWAEAAARRGPDAEAASPAPAEGTGAAMADGGASSRLEPAEAAGQELPSSATPVVADERPDPEERPGPAASAKAAAVAEPPSPAAVAEVEEASAQAPSAPAETSAPDAEASVEAGSGGAPPAPASGEIAEDAAPPAVPPAAAAGEAAPEVPTSGREPATVTLGELYLKQGHIDEAERIFRQVLARDPTNEAALDGLRRVAGKSSDQVSADGLLEQAVEVGAQPKGLTDRKVAVLDHYLRRLRSAG